MSDDDRMDRAERIRKMREGDRETDTDDGTESKTTTESTTDTSSEGDTAEPTDEADVTMPDEPASTGAEPTTDSEAWFDEESGTGDDGETADTDTDGSQSAEDALSAAERAAQSAAQLSGGDAATPGGDQPGDISATATAMQGPTGVELPDQQLLEEAMTGTGTSRAEGGARAAAVGEETSQSEELVRVLEFALSGEHYCLDIEYVEEIVKRDTITRVPNTPDYVEGVVDLRGQITTILDPTAMMDVDDAGSQDLIVVFDPDMSEDQGAIGWVVDEVRQVAPITEDQINDPPVDAEYINGVVDREDQDQFVIWIEPDDALEQATLDDGD
ncbi:chemotaxis protein CheW [Halomicroarcula sp. GCM10025709]|uniref:chemotaxis protein CheW n=1 Tax=Haloarcula TaxID=2237 RepID=UPI0024C4160D|nr:chemotaxis protein CheW [Halomicroarcula sp. YJ-61-S]